ncbi:MAG: SRPBCC family protein [Atopobiaceae bacterium]|jgi:hypothetical protein|nr:SRPBCC family protein [Atopobiaceae bacterium]
MSRLVDTIDIEVPVERAWEFFEDMPNQFVLWNPDHEAFEMLDGDMGLGSRIRYVTRLGGYRYEMLGTIVTRGHNSRGFHIQVEYDGGISSTHFIGTALDEGSCRITYAEDFGVSDAGAGRLVNFLAYDVLAGPRRFSREMLDLMRRDDAYLKCILETGLYPEPRKAPRACGRGARLPQPGRLGALLRRRALGPHRRRRERRLPRGQPRCRQAGRIAPWNSRAHASLRGP